MSLGELLAYFFIFVWFPYSAYCLGRAARWVLFPPNNSTEKKSKKVSSPPKPSKRSYPVETSFKEEYRINNPVEFDD